LESQQPGSPYEITVTVDCALPYAEDLTQQSVAIPFGGAVVTNYGNRPSYPVWKINAGLFTLTNVTTGDSFSFDDTLPGCANVGAGYVEIDTFRNTAYLNGSGANLKPGIVMSSSDFFLIPPGANTITISGGNTGTCLLNSAWA
jgi:phage-related protein